MYRNALRKLECKRQRKQLKEREKKMVREGGFAPPTPFYRTIAVQTQAL